MYLLNSPTTIEWVLGVTSNTLLFSDLNLIVTDPAGQSEFLTSPIAEEDFIAPTNLVKGLASYVITPDSEGFWQVRVVTGTADSHKILSKVDLQVQTSQTAVNTTEIH